MKLKLFIGTMIMTVLMTGCSGSDGGSGGGTYSLKISMDGQTSSYSNFIGDQGLATGSDGTSVFSMATGTDGGAAINITNFDNVYEEGNYSPASGDDVIISVIKGQVNYITNSDFTYTITNKTSSVIEGTYEGNFEAGFGSGIFKNISGSFKAKVFNLNN